MTRILLCLPFLALAACEPGISDPDCVGTDCSDDTADPIDPIETFVNATLKTASWNGNVLETEIIEVEGATYTVTGTARSTSETGTTEDYLDLLPDVYTATYVKNMDGVTYVSQPVSQDITTTPELIGAMCPGPDVAGDWTCWYDGYENYPYDTEDVEVTNCQAVFNGVGNVVFDGTEATYEDTSGTIAYGALDPNHSSMKLWMDHYTGNSYWTFCTKQ